MSVICEFRGVHQVSRLSINSALIAQTKRRLQVRTALANLGLGWFASESITKSFSWSPSLIETLSDLQFDHVEAFVDAYQRGLNGSQAAWAAKKYHGHHILPPSILSELDTQAAN